jgi:hypothetical protein
MYPTRNEPSGMPLQNFKLHFVWLCFPSDTQLLDISMCNNFLYNDPYAASNQMGALPAPMMCAIILPASVLHFTNHSNNYVLMHTSAPAIAALSIELVW